MKTSGNALKSKAHDGGEDCQLGLLGEELKNPLVYMGSYLTGKEFSTFLSAALSSREVKDHALCTHLASAFVAIHKSMTDRCNVFLSNIDTPPSIVALLKDRSAISKQEIETLQNYMYPNLSRIMRTVFEWSTLLDYCELVPLRLSKARLTQEGPIQPLWIVGAGEFGSTKSPSILSVPSQSWRPELLFLGEKWMVDYPRDRPNLTHYFAMMDWSGMIENGVAVMSWKDADYLAHMHKAVDIEAGMMVAHEFGFDTRCSNLNWISKAYAESLTGAGARRAFENAESLKWMAKGTKFDNNMLAIMDINDETIPGDHMDGFYERIVKLMVEVEKWIR